MTVLTLAAAQFISVAGEALVIAHRNGAQWTGRVVAL